MVRVIKFYKIFTFYYYHLTFVLFTFYKSHIDSWYFT